MSFVWQLFRTIAPLLITSMGVLVSEYAGVMAIFADGFINLGAFLWYLFMIKTNSFFIAILLSLVICCVLGFIASWLTIRLQANPFLTGLALNVSVSGFISLISVEVFGTRGVLAENNFVIHSSVFTFMVWLAWILAGLCALVLLYTKSGLYIRITGSNPDVMIARGLSPKQWKMVSWSVSAFFAAFAGCLLSLSLASFVPNISAGRGWTALVAVFLGRKKISGVFFAVLIFGLAEYIGNNIQRIAFFADFPSSILLSLPYIAALLLIGGSKKNKE